MTPKREIFDVGVCVVGGAGFLGSHLVNHLIDDRKCQVLVIDNLVTGRKEFLHPDATFEHYDITGSESYLHRLFRHHKIEYVFNYAAEPYIPVSFERPIHVFNTNAFGAIKVINAAQEAGVEGILQVSSAEIYGDNIDGNLDEDSPVRPHSSYGASKAAIDYLIQARYKEAKTPCIALRQFNCVGERETHPYVIPEIISQLAKQNKREATINLGNNSQRDFLYAGDAVRMAAALLERGEFGEVYNMGSENTYFIYDIARIIADVMSPHYTLKIETDQDRVRPWEIWCLQSDNTKLYSTISTRPQVTFTEALRRTIEDFYGIGSRWVWE